MKPQQSRLCNCKYALCQLVELSIEGRNEKPIKGMNRVGLCRVNGYP
jgi:hypothetical protein